MLKYEDVCKEEEHYSTCLMIRVHGHVISAGIKHHCREGAKFHNFSYQSA